MSNLKVDAAKVAFERSLDALNRAIAQNAFGGRQRFTTWPREAAVSGALGRNDARPGVTPNINVMATAA